MLTITAAPTTPTGLSSAPNLVCHMTETRAMIKSSSAESAVHPSIFNGNRTQAFTSPTATLNSESSSSQITVLPINGLGESADVIDEISADHRSHQVEQKLIPSTARNKYGYQSNHSKVSRTGRMLQQGYPFILPLKSLSTTLWIDRALLLLGVFIPLSLGVCFFLVHSFTDFASCQPVTMASTVSNKFVNQVCRTKLMQVILRGSKGIDNENRVTGSLQHECFPIILVIVAILNWIPHLCWHLSVRQSIYCDTAQVASELRSFRKTAQRELLSIASTISSVPINSYFMPIIQENDRKVSTTCQTPIQRRSGEEFTTVEPRGNIRLSKLETTVSTTDTGYESEMDLPSAAVIHLPKLRVSRDDNALNFFIAGWQNSDFYVRRFLAKHAVLVLFNMITFVFVVTLSIFTYGEPFSGSFYCRPTEKSTALHICLTSTTFALNMVAFCLGALGLTGAVCFLIFFHRNFTCKRAYKESTIACGTKSIPCDDLATRLISRCDENFFADYIRLLALARMQLRGSLFSTRREFFNLRLSYLPGLTRTDFHFINLLCKENIRCFPDAMNLRVWLLRYVFLCRHLGARVSRRTTYALSNHLRSEDLSSRLGFHKIRVEVDICD